MTQEKIDKWFQHEGLDRTHMMLVMLEQSLGFVDPDQEFTDRPPHPAIWNQRCAKALMDATSALCELYQAIGEWEEDD